MISYRRATATIVFCLCAFLAESGVPSDPKYFDDQLVDHISTDDDRRWTHRYYASDEYFQGAGSPIFVIMGGEGEILPSTGLYYPFIVNHLAKDFGAMVIQPEHRFYGVSQPVDVEFVPENANITRALMNSEQAMWDYIRLIRYTQASYGCSFDRGNRHYCPIVTVGGSYPGFLSAMMRLRHPDVVDMAYSASAPMKFYAQQVDNDSYYDHITKVAEKSSIGCKNAVKSVLDGIASLIQNIKTVDDLYEFSSDINICNGTLPSYIIDDESIYGNQDMNHVRKSLLEELVMVVGYTFANYNMANYPPDNSTALYHACQTFQNDELSDPERVSKFLVKVVNSMENEPNNSCFNMTNQMPSGVHATISSGDWSGVGSHRNGQMWDFQTCDLCVEHIGFGQNSMFPARDWTLDWLNDHCRKRFGFTPRPYELANKWHIDDLVNKTNASHILFTNGLNDGWSVGGILESLSDTLPVINFENGAHHSDLSGVGPSDKDTDDIKEGFVTIRNILQEWLMEVKSIASHNNLRGETAIHV